MKKKLSRVVLACTLMLTCVSTRAFAAQGARGRVTGEEKAEAREVAAAFMNRFFETHDFAAVVDELYVPDYMPRYVRSRAAAEERAADSTFMLEGIPSLSFGRRLAAHADDELWPRLFVAANNFMHYGLASVLSRRTLEEMSDPEKMEQADMLAAYPPEALKVLDANPALANFNDKVGEQADVRTLAELRAVTEGMEKAERLTRAGFAARVPATETLERNLAVLKAMPAVSEVTLAAGAEEFGYPEGTRLFKVFAPPVYDLLLVREGGRMKIVWAFVADD
ncbi:MAG TPA: hypothetical protein VM936_07565 [Pyrinomonadaceae bacterium]|jgi:predicted RNA-binding Zn ribbon-like protein|nr:hypothetical protein [Pyrinomonadaceae bacterium]